MADYVIKTHLVRFWSTLWVGYMISNMLSCLQQDMYGGLEGYIAHLRAPGAWADSSITGPIECVLLALFVVIGWKLRANAVERDKAEAVAREQSEKETTP